MSIFSKFHRRRREEQRLEERIEEQRRVSDETLQYVESVLARKDELLAEAVNQTGGAVRQRRRAHA